MHRMRVGGSNWQITSLPPFFYFFEPVLALSLSKRELEKGVLKGAKKLFLFFGIFIKIMV